MQRPFDQMLESLQPGKGGKGNSDSFNAKYLFVSLSFKEGDVGPNTLAERALFFSASVVLQENRYALAAVAWQTGAEVQKSIGAQGEALCTSIGFPRYLVRATPQYPFMKGKRVVTS